MICVQCKKNFIKSHHQQKYCSEECRKVKENAIANALKKLWRKNNSEKAKLLDKKYRLNKMSDPVKRKRFLEQVAKGAKKYLNTPEGKEKHREAVKKYFHTKVEGGLTRGELYKKKNKEDRKKNPDKFKAKDKKYRIQKMKDPVKSEQRRKTMNAWMKKKRETDPFFKIRATLSASLAQFLKKKGYIKSSSITKMIGCSKEELKLHLEKSFYPHPVTKRTMNWKNHSRSGWHVDHIRPLNSFKNEDLNDPKVLKKAMNYQNLQPLWAEYNMKKGDKY